MDFTQVIRHRRMVRNYLPVAVRPQATERIVSAGLSAPSAGHSQGQSLIVVTDRQVIEQISRLADEPGYTARGFDPWLSSAPVHLVVCVSPDAYRERYREQDKRAGQSPDDGWAVPYWWIDAGATLMAVLLATVNEGLAAGFMGAHSLPGLSQLLNIPDRVVPVGVVTVGHGAPDRRSRSLDRGKRPREQLAHSERWGQPF